MRVRLSVENTLRSRHSTHEMKEGERCRGGHNSFRPFTRLPSRRKHENAHQRGGERASTRKEEKSGRGRDHDLHAIPVHPSSNTPNLSPPPVRPRPPTPSSLRCWASHPRHCHSPLSAASARFLPGSSEHRRPRNTRPSSRARACNSQSCRKREKPTCCILQQCQQLSCAPHADALVLFAAATLASIATATRKQRKPPFANVDFQRPTPPSCLHTARHSHTFAHARTANLSLPCTLISHI